MTPASPSVRDEVERILKALRAEVGKSFRSYTAVEREVGLREGELNAILTGEVELGVAHLFRILHAIGVPPRQFFVKNHSK